MTTEKKRHHRTKLIITVVIYIAGAAMLSAWAFMNYRSVNLQPEDVICIAGIALILLALPLAIVTRQNEQGLILKTEALNTRLKKDVSIHKIREKELKEVVSDLERFNAVSAGRESRIIELKSEVNELLEQMNLEKRYNVQKTD